MKLEDQVCSLELAKRLEDLGVKRKSLFYWHHHAGKDYVSYGDPTLCLCKYDQLSAFTVAELVEILPKKINYYNLYITTNVHDEWLCYYVDTITSGILKKIFYLDSTNSSILGEDKNIANACAKILIYLLENNLIEV